MIAKLLFAWLRQKIYFGIWCHIDIIQTKTISRPVFLDKRVFVGLIVSSPKADGVRWIHSLFFTNEFKKSERKWAFGDWLTLRCAEVPIVPATIKTGPLHKELVNKIMSYPEGLQKTQWPPFEFLLGLNSAALRWRCLFILIEGHSQRTWTEWESN